MKRIIQISLLLIGFSGLAKGQSANGLSDTVYSENPTTGLMEMKAKNVSEKAQECKTIPLGSLGYNLTANIETGKFDTVWISPQNVTLCQRVRISVKTPIGQIPQWENSGKLRNTGSYKVFYPSNEKVPYPTDVKPGIYLVFNSIYPKDYSSINKITKLPEGLIAGGCPREWTLHIKYLSYTKDSLFDNYTVKFLKDGENLTPDKASLRPWERITWESVGPYIEILDKFFYSDPGDYKLSISEKGSGKIVCELPFTIYPLSLSVSQIELENGGVPINSYTDTVNNKIYGIANNFSLKGIHSITFNIGFNFHNCSDMKTYQDFIKKNNYGILTQLEGLDASWIEQPLSIDVTTTGAYIPMKFNYLGLTPGDYTFKLGQRENDKIKVMREIKFTILPLFWQTAIFKIIIVASVIVLLILLFFSIRTRRLRKQKGQEIINNRITTAELKSLRAQMNPHFMFNSLNAIQNFINNNKTEDANIFLSKFAELNRLILNNSEASFIPLEVEERTLRLYLELEALRFGFNWTMYIDPIIDKDNIEIPAMLIQPYIENAVNHGVSAFADKGQIHVKFEKKGSNIICTVEDNGLGIKNTPEKKSRNEAHKSMGMKLVEERIKLLSSQYTETFSVKVVDWSDVDKTKTGTRIEICMPILNS